MGFVVEVERRFRAVQGLPSPVRARRGLPGIPPGEGVEVVVRAGVEFAEEQLTTRGWFFDTERGSARRGGAQLGGAGRGFDESWLGEGLGLG